MTVHGRKSPDMARIRKRLGLGIVGAAILSLALTACGGGGADSGGGGADAKGGAIDTSTATGDDQLLAVGRQPAARLPACADEFHAKNPNITVKITQYGWDDYWSQAHQRLRRRHRPRRLHRPPLEVPGDASAKSSSCRSTTR